MASIVTIATYTYYADLVVIKSRIEAEGIPCYLRDEMTAQNQIYSQAVGGIKLQVREKDVPRAIEILREQGQLTEEDLQPPQFWSRLEERTAGWPLIKNQRVEMRLITLITLFLFALATVLYFAFILT